MPNVDLDQLAKDLGTTLQDVVERAVIVQTIDEYSAGTGTAFLAPTKARAEEARADIKKARDVLVRIAPNSDALVAAKDREKPERHVAAILANASEGPTLGEVSVAPAKAVKEVTALPGDITEGPGAIIR